MSTLGDAIAQHKDRLVHELGVALAVRPAWQAVGAQAREDFLAALFDALLMRVRVADDTRLTALLRQELMAGRLPRAQLLTSLLLLARDVRTVFFTEGQTKRVTAIASAAIDRAVADTTLELESLLEPPAALKAATKTSKTPGRDPTILRNIKEILASQDGDDIEASVVVLAHRVSQSARGVTMVNARRQNEDVAKDVIGRAGAKLIVMSAGVVAAYLPTRIDDTDADEAVALAVALAKQPELKSCGLGVARGRLCLDGKNDAFGEGLSEAMALAATGPNGRVSMSEAVHRATKKSFLARATHHEVRAFYVDPEQPQWFERWEQAALVAEPMLQGRDALVGQLAGYLLRHKGARLITLRGKPGIGKRRLLAATLDTLALPKTRVFRGTPHPLAPAPYWPLVAILRQALRLDDAPSADDVREAVMALPADATTHSRLLPLVPALSALLAPEPGDTGRDIDVESSSMRTELALALRLVLTTLAEQKPQMALVVSIEEADRLDPSTADALRALLLSYEGSAPLSVVLALRGQLALVGPLANVAHDTLTLTRLTDAAVAQVVGAMLEEDEPPVPLLREVVARAEGIPMFATMLVRYFVEAGVLKRKVGQWTWSSEALEGETPKRLPDVLRHRIEQLPASLCALLKTAATLGEPLAWPLLEIALVHQGMSKDELLRAVGLLTELMFLTETATGLRFAHPLIREVAYRLQTPAERERAHRLAAVGYEESFAQSRRELSAVLFRHYAEAKDTAGARESAVRAVEHAALLQDYKAALSLCAQALPLCIDDSLEAQSARFILLKTRERIYDVRGKRAEQKGDIKELLGLAERLRDKAKLGHAMHRAARYNLLTGDLGKARSVAQRAVAELAKGDPLELSNALRTLALVRWHDRDAAGAQAALTEALAIYERLGHARGVGVVLQSLGMFALDTSAFDVAKDHFERALKQKQATQDSLGEAAVYDALGQVALGSGDVSVAAQHFERALGLYTGMDDYVAAAQTQVNLGDCYVKHEPERAEALARAAQKAAKRGSRTQVEARLLLARSLLRQGKRTLASRAVGAALTHAKQAGARLLALRAQLLQAEIDLTFRGVSRIERAAREARLAAEAAQKSGSVRWRIEALSLLAVAQRVTDPAESQAAATEALTLLAERAPAGLDRELVMQRCQGAMIG